MVTFTFGAGVSQDDQQSVREGLSRATSFVTEMLQVPMATVAVTAIASKTSGVEPRLNDGCCAAPPGEILLDVDSADFSVARVFPRNAWLQHHAIHEYIHVWQQAQPADPRFGCIGRTGQGGTGSRAQWFIEGFANFAAYEALAAGGLASRDVITRYAALQLRATAPAELSLSTAEVRTPASYTAGHFASVLLARGGIAPFARFCAAAAAGVPWRSAFATAFGRDVDSFYAEADRYALELRASVR